MGERLPAVLAPIGFTVGGTDRMRLLTVAAGGGLVLGAAMAVFGLPPVDLHGPNHYVGIMSPTCGATRSVWAAMSGDWATSWRYNPLGILLVLGAAATLVRTAVGAATGRWVNVHIRSGRALLALTAVGTVALWIRQQLNADLVGPQPGETFSPAGLFVALAATGAYALYHFGAPAVRRRFRRA
ncbi:DUF2752 domain-containing protein [Nocardiopsis sp. RSe5-2]|uniref:DUF2752 domain-containing protein n=1 Tax=Nocardiopsis endophytica TaxID=3018445 RepID=A0ABT4U896_9ACTN|nr:DUF2752 domain-containing protein [Nocardiopsis endophytica]MDA2813180.1 DUF2752 domain-containing protein [Nocardiopsis endophytica]